ncbi:MAG: hypothetical protein Q9217_003197 [Psora testacea]
MTSVVSLALFGPLLFSSVLVSAGPLTSKILPRAAPGKYFAQGDSYGSGIASGDYVDSRPGSADWTCSRFTSAYGRQLNGLLGGATQFSHQACSGSTAEDVRNNQHVDEDADLATLTVGGNNADFGDIVDACVYGFSPNGLSDEKCNKALSKTENNIANNVWNPVWNACNDVSFNYWSGTSASYKMTQARRKAMNDLTDKLNAQLASVVENFNSHGQNRVHLVDIDTIFTGHRFCEEGVNEPQQSGTEYPNTWIFQYNTPVGSINGSVGPDADGSHWFQSIKSAEQSDPSLKVNSIYASQPVNTDEDFGSSGGLPLFFSKLFHPTGPGHEAIAQAISQAIGQQPVSVPTTTSAPPPPSPTPSCVQECECEDRPGGRCKCFCVCDGRGAPASSCR